MLSNQIENLHADQVQNLETKNELDLAKQQLEGVEFEIKKIQQERDESFQKGTRTVLMLPSESLVGIMSHA